jgi:hypothetical protein
MIALAVQLTAPVIRVHKGLAPSSECALPGAHNERARSLKSVPLTDGR